MDIKNKFQLKQKVKVIPLDNIEARIEGFYYSYYGLKYYVYFYVDYKENSGYFFEDELVVIN